MFILDELLKRLLPLGRRKQTLLQSGSLVVQTICRPRARLGDERPLQNQIPQEPRLRIHIIRGRSARGFPLKAVGTRQRTRIYAVVVDPRKLIQRVVAAFVCGLRNSFACVMALAISSFAARRWPAIASAVT